jgi:acyl carrier protein
MNEPATPAPSVKDQVRQLVLTAAQPRGITHIADDESLLKDGAIDSLSMYRLIEFVESTFLVRIADNEMIPDNFESINQLERFVSAKLESKSRTA